VHTGDKFGPVMCKCMDCAGKRFEKAEKFARKENPADYMELVLHEDRLTEDIEFAQNALKTIQKDKRDLIMTYYHALIEREKNA